MTKKKIKNKPRAEQEPRSAHGRAVNKKKINPVQSKNRARPMAARLKKKNLMQSKNRARPMAARLIKNKPRAEQEPRSAHGRAVKKKKTPCRARTALGPWPRG